MPFDVPDSAAEIARLRRRLDRERTARLEAESVSESALRELYERKQQLELLEKIATAANQSATAEDALRLAVVEVCAFTGWEVGHVLRVERNAGTASPRSLGIWHLDDADAFAAFRAATAECDFSDGVGLPGRTFAAGTALWIPDVVADANFPRHAAALQCGLRAASAFPVLSGDEVVAILEFFSSVAREPDEIVLHLMSQIGLQLGRAIERQRDAEDARRRAEELVLARDEARSANRAKSQFLANMSHELRTPLNAIIGFSELMMSESFGPLGVAAYGEYSELINSSGRHLLAIINDILDLSKIEAGKVELDQEGPVVLAELFRSAGEVVRLAADAKGVALSLAAPASLPPLVGSERMVRQMLTNLLANAVKFTPDGGSVEARAALSAGGELILSVSDSGIGMSEDEIVVALAPFGQVEGALSRRYEGTGLGLPIAQAMASLHQAELTIGSTPGVGTVIEVVFPRDRVAGTSDCLAYA